MTIKSTLTLSPMTEAKLNLIKAEAIAEILLLNNTDTDQMAHIRTLLYYVKETQTELDKYNLTNV